LVEIDSWIRKDGLENEKKNCVIGSLGDGGDCQFDAAVGHGSSCRFDNACWKCGWWVALYGIRLQI
jgi:hypothetical protein